MNLPNVLKYKIENGVLILDLEDGDIMRLNFNKIEDLKKQLNIGAVGSLFYCVSEIEGRKTCFKQCEHCKEYYKPIEQ